MCRRPLKGLPPKCIQLRFDANTREMIDDGQAHKTACYELYSRKINDFIFLCYLLKLF